VEDTGAVKVAPREKKNRYLGNSAHRHATAGLSLLLSPFPPSFLSFLSREEENRGEEERREDPPKERKAGGGVCASRCKRCSVEGKCSSWQSMRPEGVVMGHRPICHEGHSLREGVRGYR